MSSISCRGILGVEFLCCFLRESCLMKELFMLFEAFDNIDCVVALLFAILSSSFRLAALTLLLISSRERSSDRFSEYHSAYFLDVESLKPWLTSLSCLFSCSSMWTWPLRVRTCLLRALYCWHTFSPSSSITYNFPLLSSTLRIISFFSSRQWRWLSSASFITVFRWAITCPSLHSEQCEACCLPAARSLRTSSFKLPIWWVKFSTSSFSFHSLSEKNSYCLANFS